MGGVQAAVGDILLFFLVFGMSATVDVRCIRAQAQNYRALTVGMFCQFVLLPFLGFVFVRSLSLPEPVGLTLLVVTSSPGGSYSNWWCSVFNADLALSVAMTAASTFVSLVMLPLNLLIYSRLSFQQAIVAHLDWASLFISLVIVIGAITCGLLVSNKFKSRKLQKLANLFGNISGLALITFSALVMNGGNDDNSNLWARSWQFYVGCAMPCVGAIILSTAIASVYGLPKPERVTCAIECCYQNIGIAASLALAMFDGDDLDQAIGVPFYYGAVEAVCVGTYCLICWKTGWTKAPPNAPFWQVVTTSYEVLELEQGLRVINGIEIVDSSDNDDNSQAESHVGDTFTTYFFWSGHEADAPKKNDDIPKDIETITVIATEVVPIKDEEVPENKVEKDEKLEHLTP